MSNYTKGPGEVCEGNPYRVMQCNEGEGINTRFGRYICDTANNAKTRTPENVANAKVISCAPEFAEILLYVANYGRAGLTDSTLEKIEALLKKAGVL